MDKDDEYRSRAAEAQEQANRTVSEVERELWRGESRLRAQSCGLRFDPAPAPEHFSHRLLVTADIIIVPVAIGAFQRDTCVYRKLDSAILVVKAAENRV